MKAGMELTMEDYNKMEFSLGKFYSKQKILMILKNFMGIYYC
jgi:hypothetical protein